MGRDTIGALPTGYRKLIIFIFYRGYSTIKSTCDKHHHPFLFQLIMCFFCVSVEFVISKETEDRRKAKVNILNVRKSKTSDELEFDSSEANSLLLQEAKRP